MAESAIVSALLPLVFEKLSSGMLQQLGKMLGVPRELEKLHSTLKAIQSVLRDAEEKEVKDEALRDWLGKLKNAAYDAADVLDEVHYERMWKSADIHHGIKNKVIYFFCSSHNPLFFRVKMARKVKDIVNKLDEIAAERSKFHLRIDGAVEERRFQWRQTHSYVIESEVVGRREDKRRIIEILVSDGSSSSGVAPRVLPIVGMGGLGKTTLAQMVYNDKDVTTHFELCMWVCVSEDFNIPRLVKEIILSGGESGKDINKANMDQLQCKPRNTLNSKRYLLVLDDVWNEDPNKWAELRALLTLGGVGSTIIVTTRSKIVARIVGTLDPYQLAHLSKEACWELFEQSAFPSGGGKRPELVEIGKKLAERCRGLPLGAKVTGSMMHLKTEEREWLSVLESEVWDMQDGTDGILSILKLSYKHLLPHLKQCFVFCAIFPKDHEIQKEQLIQLWMANGFIPAEGRLQLEEKGEYIFKELASRSFFQDIEEVVDDDGRTITICKIHDLMHDLAQSIMSKDCVILNDEPLKRTPDDGTIRYLVIVENTNSSTLNTGICKFYKTLRTLVRLPRYEYRLEMQVPYFVRSNLVLLHVLDLRWSDISELPFSVSNLKHLRYLDLSDTAIKVLPKAISQLFYLQTLKIEDCHELRELPKRMRNMSNLRHVYNRGCDRITSMPRGLDKLSYLQTLTMYVASRRGGRGGIAELKDLNLGGVLHLRNLENVMHRADAMEAHLGSKKKIESLVLEWEFHLQDDSENITEVDNPEEIMEALQPHKEIKSLRIVLYRGQQSPSWLVGCHLLKKLVTDKCSSLIDIPCLPSLTELRVEGCPFLFPANKGFFRRMACLETLWIKSSDKLVLLLESEDDGDDEWSAPLQELSISRIDARMFSSEPCLGTWKNLSSLDTLHFEQCSGLVSFPDDLLRVLRSLRRLTIWECKSFTGGEGGLRLQHLTSLERLDINDCEALRSISLDGLQRLRDFYISHCSKLNGLQGLTALHTLSLGSFATETTLPNWLPTLTGLNNLTIESCPALTTLPDGMEELALLTTLTIEFCPLLADLPVGLQQRLPHLQSLVIIECPLLEGRCREGGDYWHLVSSIPDKTILGI